MAIDLDSIDDENPFEIDDQLAHLFKHPGLGYEDALDVWGDAPVFFPAAHPPAELLMVGSVAGGILVVPLCPAQYSGPTKVRPIGVFTAGLALADLYRGEQ